MIYVLVEHFLDDAGRAYFSDWVEELRPILDKFDGYQTLELLQDITEASRSVLLLRFASMPQLRAWANSSAHTEALSRIRPYQVRKQVSQIFTT